MTEAKPEKCGKGWAFSAAVVFGALVLYVLSFGPFWKIALNLIERKVVSGETVNNVSRVVYAPIYLVASHSESVYEMQFHYLKWWLGQKFAQPGPLPTNAHPPMSEMILMD